MTQETIVAIYDSAYAAGAACAELVDAGLPDDAVTWTSAASAQMAANSRPRRERSFWSNLFGGEPDHDTVVYDRSVESGSDVLTVRVPGEQVARYVAILEKHRPIDIDERARSYRLTPPSPVGGDDTIYGSGDAMLPLSEEQLSVGKRLVDRGTTRVRRFVVDTPIERRLTLHAERVSVERRAVAGFAQSPEAFTDKVVAMAETDEMPVVGKTSRVAEEVTLRRATDERVETIRDSLRREEVEITRTDGATAVPDARRPR